MNFVPYVRYIILYCLLKEDSGNFIIILPYKVTEKYRYYEEDTTKRSK